MLSNTFLVIYFSIWGLYRSKKELPLEHGCGAELKTTAAVHLPSKEWGLMKSEG